MKKINWIWLLIVSFVFVNASVWLHFIYYEKYYEKKCKKIVREETVELLEGYEYVSDKSMEYLEEVILLNEEKEALQNEIWLLKAEINGTLPPAPKLKK